MALSQQLLSAIHVIAESQKLLLENQQQLAQLKRCTCSSAIRPACVCTESNVLDLIQADEFANRLIALQAAMTFNQRGLELLAQRHEMLELLLKTIEQWEGGLCSEKELDLVWQSYLLSIDESVH